MKSRVSQIKKAQKESLLLREISQLYQKAAMDDARLYKATVSRVALSKDKSLCTVYFYTETPEEFEELLPILKLYKPSLRKALASSFQARYVPELKFAYDPEYERRMRLESLFETIKSDTQEDPIDKQDTNQDTDTEEN